MFVNTLIGISIAAFVALLAMSIYFRLRVFKHYKVLIENRVEFDRSHMFDQEKLEREILPKYPKYKENILGFIGGIKFAMKCASAMIVVITICAAGIMFFSE